jgi:DNA-binding beta-propeller fold protein YncE
MGGNGIAVVSVGDFIYQGTIVGIKQNVRHLIQDDNILFIGTNKTGYVQKTDLNIMLDSFNGSPSKGNFLYKNWTSSYVGTGVRTIAKTNHKNYVFAAVNNSSELVILDAKSLSIIGKMRVDSYPVGMAISPDDKYLIVTSQGRRSAGGNSVMVFEIKENTR